MVVSLSHRGGGRGGHGRGRGGHPFCSRERNLRWWQQGDDDGNEEEDNNGGYGGKKKPRGDGKTTNARDAAEGGSSSLSSSSPHGPINVYRLPTSRNNKYVTSNFAFHSINHHWSELRFVTSSSDESVRVWDPKRSAPMCTFNDFWGSNDNNVLRIVEGRVSHKDAACLLHGVHL